MYPIISIPVRRGKKIVQTPAQYWPNAAPVSAVNSVKSPSSPAMCCATLMPLVLSSSILCQSHTSPLICGFKAASTSCSVFEGVRVSAAATTAEAAATSTEAVSIAGDTEGGGVARFGGLGGRRSQLMRTVSGGMVSLPSLNTYFAIEVAKMAG